MTALLQLCDVVRDDTLPELGVRLEDHEGGRSGLPSRLQILRSDHHARLCSRSAHCGQTGGQRNINEGARGEEEGEEII